MKLTIKNVGPIKEADIDINSITMIAGSNGSGKTTIAKLLYVYGKTESIVGKKDSINFIHKSVNKLLVSILVKLDAYYLIEIVRSKSTNIEEKIKLVKDAVGKKRKNKDFIDKSFKEIDDYIALRASANKLTTIIKNRYLRKEFRDHLKRINTEESAFTTNSNSSLNDIVLMCAGDISLNNDGVEIDDWVAVKETSHVLNHQEDFFARIKKPNDTNPATELLKEHSSDELEQIKSKLLDGNFYFDDNDDVFIYEKDGQKYYPINTANGIKTLGYFSQLLTLDFVINDNILILDEPEISLHPTWQVKFANALVELSEKFGLKIVILSHSPYFIDAIRNFTTFSGVKTNWYLLKETVDGYIALDTTDDVGLIAEALDEGFSEIDRKKLKQTIKKTHG